MGLLFPYDVKTWLNLQIADFQYNIAQNVKFPNNFPNIYRPIKKKSPGFVLTKKKKEMKFLTYTASFKTKQQ